MAIFGALAICEPVVRKTESKMRLKPQSNQESRAAGGCCARERSGVLVAGHNLCVLSLEKSYHKDLDVRRGWCEV